MTIKTQGHRERLVCFHLISSCLMSPLPEFPRGRETGTRKTFLSNTGGKLWCAILPLPRGFTFVLDTRWLEPPALFSGFFQVLGSAGLSFNQLMGYYLLDPNYSFLYRRTLHSWLSGLCKLNAEVSSVPQDNACEVRKRAHFKALKRRDEVYSRKLI